MAALVTTVGGVASAASAHFTADAVHGGGTGATGAYITGTLSWSTSLKTVTITGGKFYIKANECSSWWIGGYQGSTLVSTTVWVDEGCASQSQNYTEDYGPFSLTSGPPGGVQWVKILVTDETDQITGYAYCYQSQSSCQTGQY